jgi:hypothetical protein
MSSEYTVRPGDMIRLAPEEPPMPGPADIASFLRSRGWYADCGEWNHMEKNRVRMTWEQAMACEFYEFITLGGR